MTKWFHGYTDTYIHVVTEYPHIHISTHFRAYFKIHVAGLVHVLISAVKTSLLVSNKLHCTCGFEFDKKKVYMCIHWLSFFAGFFCAKNLMLFSRVSFLATSHWPRSLRGPWGLSWHDKYIQLLKKCGIILLDNKYGWR